MYSVTRQYFASKRSEARIEYEVREDPWHYKFAAELDIEFADQCSYFDLLKA